MRLRRNIFIILIVCFGTLSFHAQEKKSRKKKAKKEVVTEVSANAGVVEGLNLGNKAPEIDMMDPAGQPVKLSSLKGKVVLIDFWASWCRPCRIENPKIVALQEKYKEQKFKNGTGFTVYSVSLDNNKDAWQTAIATDGLKWPSHVSDLAGWNNAAAAKYGVSAIPTNYLIDGDGIIIGKALKGNDLEKVIENNISK